MPGCHLAAQLGTYFSPRWKLFCRLTLSSTALLLRRRRFTPPDREDKDHLLRGADPVRGRGGVGRRRRLLCQAVPAVAASGVAPGECGRARRRRTAVRQ